MGNGINKVILVAALGKDPETRYAANGNPVASFSVATSESWKDKQGQKQENTEWHNITAFGKLAEICGEYLKKGSKVYLEGKLSTEKWQDKQGNDRYTTKVIINEMQMLDSRSGDATTQQAKPAQQPSNIQQSPNNQSPHNPVTDDFDDSIPF